MNTEDAKSVVEALLFASRDPLARAKIAEITGLGGKEITQVLAQLELEYSQPGRGLRIVQVAGGYRIKTKAELHEWVSKLQDTVRPFRLSFAALETLAVIAYRQPFTQAEVQEIRGVNSSGVLKTLLEKKLVKVVGRKKVIGRPLLYGTTDEFLIHFGLKDLSELPSIEEFEEILSEDSDIAEPPQASREDDVEGGTV